MIRFDFNNMMAKVIGKHGLTPAHLEKAAPQIKAAASSFAAARVDQASRVKLGIEWLELPYQDSRLIDEIVKMAGNFDRRFKNIISLGIGGSYLGNKMLHESLLPPNWNEFENVREGRPRLYFSGNNVDPVSLKSLLDNLDPKSTGIIVISKSGETTETKAAFEIVKAWLAGAVGDKFAEHIIAVTDPQAGSLRREVETHGYISFPVPAGVGGRFSVLSPVGLITASAAGIDIRQLLAGAAAMEAGTRNPDPNFNPALKYAALQWLAYKELGKCISIIMPFADQLKTFSEWYIQLLAESLGKRLSLDGLTVNTGRTPVPSVGTTDLHSIQQNNIEGEPNKVITFIRVDDFAANLAVPTGAGGFLAGQSLQKLIAAAQAGTEWALAQAGRPSSAVILPRLSPHTLGQLIFFFEMATAFEGQLLNVNAFDQPGVEGYKQYMSAALGKPGAGTIQPTPKFEEFMM